MLSSALSDATRGPDTAANARAHDPTRNTPKTLRTCDVRVPQLGPQLVR
jgi:hypothetical protein